MFLVEAAGNIEISNTLTFKSLQQVLIKIEFIKNLGIKNLIELFKIYRNLD
ncbi:hypothetical protein SAMN05421664_0582 [Chryseobacterium soldanellicola]|uniref:Uncharacterized protein n=1 Tax=Chryseobacterium soldanellicola TaxID=311333 RepID=A0A1H0Y9E0_9FLAO|nr:hypothetical protein SAMN05421664_0582 [Chryseobacterium soldanellicola]